MTSRRLLRRCVFTISSSARIFETDVDDVDGRVNLVVSHHGPRPQDDQRPSSVHADQTPDNTGRDETYGLAETELQRRGGPRGLQSGCRQRRIRGSTPDRRDHSLGRGHRGFRTARVRRVLRDHRGRTVIDRDFRQVPMTESPVLVQPYLPTRKRAPARSFSERLFSVSTCFFILECDLLIKCVINK